MKKQITIEVIRQYVGYSTINDLRRLWQTKAHPGKDFPNKNVPLTDEEAKPILEILSNPSYGRAQRVVDAARALLSNIETGEELKEPEWFATYSNESAPKSKAETKPMRVRVAKQPMQEVKQSEVIATIEIEKPEESKRQVKRSSKGITLKEWFSGTFGDFLLIDLVTYSSILVMNFAAYEIIPNAVGHLFGAVLSFICLHSLFLAKSRRLRDAAWQGIIGVIAIEAVAFMLDYNLFYNSLKDNYIQLPWIGDDRDSAYVLTAKWMSAIICLFSVYAIWNRISVTSAALLADDFEQQHEQEY